MRFVRSLVFALAPLAACGASSDPVGVTLVDLGNQPVSGVRVVGNDAVGAKVDEATTDSDGRVELAVSDGGSITVVDVMPAMPGYDAHLLQTVFSVAPGDELELRLVRGGPGVRALQVTVPPLPAGVTRYQVEARCAVTDGVGPTVELFHDGRCPPRGPIVVSAQSETGVIAFLVMPDADLDGDAVTVTGEWMPASQRFTVDVSGVPTGASVSVGRTLRTDGFPVSRTGGSVLDQMGTASVSGSRPNVGDATDYNVTIDQTTGCFATSRASRRVRPGNIDALALDVANFLPPIGDVTVGDREIGWSGGGGGTTVEVGIEAALTSTGGRLRTWSAFAPAGTASLHFPSDLGVPWPGDEPDFVIAYATVMESESTQWSSYAERRADLLPADRAPTELDADSTFAARDFTNGCQ